MTIPSLRIEPEFRQELEEALEEGEIQAAPVELAVRGEVDRRREHAEILRRGLVAIKRTVESGDGFPADVVISKLRAKLRAVRKRGARSA